MLVWWHHCGMVARDDHWITPQGVIITHAEWLAKGQALVDRIEARFAEMQADGSLREINRQYKSARKSAQERGQKSQNYPQFLYGLKRKALQELIRSIRIHAA